MSLLLSLPEPTKIQSGQIELDPARIKAWLASLPDGRVAEAARATHDGLAALNRVKVDAAARVKLLDEYAIKINMLEAPLELLFAGRPLPLAEAGKTAVNLARSLLIELAYGYKLVLLERLERRFNLGSRNIPELLRQVMTLHQRLLMVSYKAYMPAPAEVWRDLHRIFLYAVHNKLIDEPADEGAQRTIGLVYRQTLLLALMDPYRLSHQEVERVNDLLQQEAGYAQFEPLRETTDPAGFFLVRMDSDAPPQYMGQRPGDADARTDILLNTTELVRHLHKRLSRLEDQPRALLQGAQIEIMNLRRMIRQWGIAPKRLFQRMTTDSLLSVVPGLTQACIYLIHDLSPADAEALLADDLDHNLLPIVDITLPGVVTELPPASTWAVFNESPGGFALRKMSREPLAIQHGDLLLLRAVGSQPWLVGVVRWLQHVDSSGLEIGVQVLSPKAQPVLVRPLDPALGDRFQPALLLPALPAVRQRAALVTGRGMAQAGCPLEVRGSKEFRSVTPGRLLDYSSGFEWFEFAAGAAV